MMAFLGLAGRQLAMMLAAIGGVRVVEAWLMPLARGIGLAKDEDAGLGPVVQAVMLAGIGAGIWYLLGEHRRVGRGRR